MGGFTAGPGGAGPGGLGGAGVSLPGMGGGDFGSSGAGFIQAQSQIVANKILSGEISDPNAIATAINSNPTLKGILIGQAVNGANNFNPSNAPAWLKVLVAAVPALAAIIKIGTSSGPSIVPARPGTPTTVSPGGSAPASTSAVPGAGVTPAATTDIAGRPISSSAILPGEVPPINPSLQDAWNKFLSQNVGTGIPQYPGQISATPNANLTGTWGAFNPDVTKTPGADFISQMLKSGALSNPAQVNPILAQMMKTGTPTGAPSPLAPYAAQSPGYLAPFLAQGVPGYQAPSIP